VRVYEKADKFAIGQSGNKSTKFVEAAKGTNLFFAIYEKEIIDELTGEVIKKRSFATIPLNIVIERLKSGLSPAPADDNGNEPTYLLSPNDLVYVPMEGEDKKSLAIDKKRIYKMVSCTGNEAHFIPSYIANPILQTIELGSNNKAQKSWTHEMIKEVCIPITVDRLGNIKLRE
jgi:CRISPR-associated endonuclease Csn1